MATRKELMIQLNELLNTELNWGRLSLLDLERLVINIKKQQLFMRSKSEIRAAILKCLKPVGTTHDDIKNLHKELGI